MTHHNVSLILSFDQKAQGTRACAPPTRSDTASQSSLTTRRILQHLLHPCRLSRPCPVRALIRLRLPTPSLSKRLRRRSLPCCMAQRRSHLQAWTTQAKITKHKDAFLISMRSDHSSPGSGRDHEPKHVVSQSHSFSSSRSFTFVARTVVYTLIVFLFCALVTHSISDKNEWRTHPN